MEAGFDVPLSRSDLTAAERFTLEVGCAVVLATLALGLQLGGWPVWATPMTAAGYLAWTVLYSEATIQAARLQERRAGQIPISLTAQPVAPPG